VGALKGDDAEHFQSAAYSPPWTRAARKKYLADRKQAEIEGMKKKSKLLSWIRGDEEDEEESSTLVRDIKADEVDSKMGTSKVEVVPIQKEPGSNGIHADSTDASLKEEVDQELRLRKEEERSKQSRTQMKRLSSDNSSGLWSGGGGARAMMRQLEEAERIEKRASVQRSNTRSPAIVAAEIKREESRPMGAVKDTVVQPFTSPRRLSDSMSSPPTNVSTLRSPSPQTPQQHSSQQKKKVVAPSKEEMTKDKDREHRHPSPSILIRRELSLGIPVHSTAAGNRSSWPAHPPTRTPSPRLIHPTTLEDIAEVPSTNLTEVGGSGASTPRRANTIGHSSNIHPTVNRRRNGVDGDAKIKRASTLSGKPINFGNDNLGVNISQHAGEGRFGHARIKN